jgi:hypothetical protein
MAAEYEERVNAKLGQMMLYGQIIMPMESSARLFSPSGLNGSVVVIAITAWCRPRRALARRNPDSPGFS